MKPEIWFPVVTLVIGLVLQPIVNWLFNRSREKSQLRADLYRCVYRIYGQRKIHVINSTRATHNINAIGLIQMRLSDPGTSNEERIKLSISRDEALESNKIKQRRLDDVYAKAIEYEAELLVLLETVRIVFDESKYLKLYQKVEEVLKMMNSQTSLVKKHSSKTEFEDEHKRLSSMINDKSAEIDREVMSMLNRVQSILS